MDSHDPLGLAGLLGTRHSVRRFSAEPIDVETISRLLEAACAAPSAHNRQPWRFVVMRGGELRRRWAEAMQAAFRRDLEADGLSAAEVESRVTKSTERILHAPAAILLCMTMEDMDRYRDARRQDAEQAMAEQSVALAGGQLLLAAHAEGLGGCWLCAPLFAPEVCRQELDLPSTWEPQALILIGRPLGEPRHTSRRPISDVSVWR